MDLLKIRRVCILCLPKHFRLTIIIVLLINFSAHAQFVKKYYDKDSFKLFEKETLLIKNKIILPTYKEAIYAALFAYPELHNTKIVFRERAQKSPLSANITLFSLFKKRSKRFYLINVSTTSTNKLNAIRLSQLSYNAQIGVLGHEIAHIAEFQRKSIFYFIKLAFGHLSKNYIDKHEFNTDLRCIEHGLGYQLLAWSNEVRVKLKIPQWGGASKPKRATERYMNPQTIQYVLDTMKIYN